MAFGKVAENSAVRLGSAVGALHTRPRGSNVRNGERSENKPLASQGREDRIHQATFTTERSCHDDLGLRATTGEEEGGLRRGKRSG